MAEPRPVALLAASRLWERLDGGTLAVACSGGRDSVALARAAQMLLSNDSFCARFDSQPKLVLWHMDHGLRDDSTRDAELVEQLAAQLGVEHAVTRLDLTAELAENGGNAEELARKRRYEELLQWLKAKPPSGPKQLALAATAHHLGDQAETIIFNLVRGTHIAGLRGIAPLYEERIYRPWLALAPEEITAFLGELKQGYIDDPGNTDTKLARVKLRREVLPALQEINPRAREHIARLADTAATAERYIAGMLHDLPVERFSGRTIAGWLPLIGWPGDDYYVYRLDDGWENSELTAIFVAGKLIARTGALKAAEHDAITAWAVAPAARTIVRGYSLTRPHRRLLAISGSLEAADPSPELALRLGKSASIGGLHAGLAVTSRDEWRQQSVGATEPWEQIRSWPRMLDALTASPPIRPVWNCFLPAGIALPLTLRTWREGDRIELTGGGSKKLGDIFTDAKVPSCFRPVWAVLTDAKGALLWVPGLADSAAMALAHDATPEHLVTLKVSG